VPLPARHASIRSVEAREGPDIIGQPNVEYEGLPLTIVIRWDEKAGLRRDAMRSQVIDGLEAQEIERPAMKEEG
jgi:hypothetical protein